MEKLGAAGPPAICGYPLFAPAALLVHALAKSGRRDDDAGGNGGGLPRDVHPALRRGAVTAVRRPEH
jgi:hypothetical protein